jgi:hypothetical protein
MVLRVDCTLKSQNLPLVPIRRKKDHSIIERMKFTLDDPLIKSEYIFEIFRMGVKGYVDLIGSELFPMALLPVTQDVEID